MPQTRITSFCNDMRDEHRMKVGQMRSTFLAPMWS
jgi:hypothetical protein